MRIESQVEIRAAQPQEAQRLTVIAMSAKAHWGYAAGVLERWRRDLTIDAAHIVSYPVYVAQVESAVAGFYMLMPGTVEWTLEHLWVSPSSMRRGIGMQLIRHALDMARRGGAQGIKVTADPNAAGFYEHAGGRRCGALPAPIPGARERTLPLYEFAIHAGR